jgi:hypothetical protein
MKCVSEINKTSMLWKEINALNFSVCCVRPLAFFQKGFSSYFLIPAYCWFIDEIVLSVALALYLWEHEILAWLLEHMILLVECVRLVWFVREECISSNGEVDRFSFVGPCRPYIPCNWQDDFHHRGHIWHKSILFFFFFCIAFLSGYLRI